MKRMKRSYRGLFGNRMIKFGNKVSFAENKTRRTWKPNVQMKTMLSETLQEKFKWRMTTYVMRCIRKFGGLDEYLLRTRDSEIKFPVAIEVKRRIIETREKNAAKAEPTTVLSKEQQTPKPSNEEKNTMDKVQASPAAISAVKIAAGPGHSAPIRGTPAAKFSSRGLLELL